jgi:hypothetical protein
MPTEYSGNSASFPATVTLPSDGEVRDALSYNDGLSDLADRTAFLAENAIDGLDGGTYTPTSPIQILGDEGLDVETLGVSGLFDSNGWTPRFGLQNWSVVNPHHAGAVAGAMLPTSIAQGGTYVGGRVSHWIIAGTNSRLFLSSTDADVILDNVVDLSGDGAGNMISAIAGVNDIAVAIGARSSGTGTTFGVWWANLATAVGTWNVVTVGDTTKLPRDIGYSEPHGKYIIVGRDDTQPYILTSNDNTGTAWTARTAPASFAGKRLASLTVGTSGPGNGIAVAAAGVSHTKLAVSTDGGTTWVDSTTTLTDAVYQVAWNSTLQLFVASSGGPTFHVYTSPDGMVWTLRFSSTIASGITGWGTIERNRRISWYGHAIVLAVDNGYPGGGSIPSIAYSLDIGATWEVVPVGRGGSVQSLIGSAQGGRLLLAYDVNMSRCMRRSSG